MEGEFKIPNSKINFENLVIFYLLAAILSLYSCASFRVVPDGKILRDNFSRTYNVDFAYFHPRLNLALQDYAQGYKGNSFQVIRLGSDAVIIQGLYKAEGRQDQFPAVITAKPAGPKKTWVEIKISSNNPGASSEYLEKVARELFRIIERGIETSSP